MRVLTIDGLRPLQFTKIRVSGFKSFVDATELDIEPGLSGVVGPNGCGKSNLVEALRWVMGETSAKKMRGGGMDDVIFGGTADRPARNIAEVILTLDNAGRNAPAAHNDSDELQISRRIERESGSTYRINGKEVRARDVQLLFADLATGARSAAIVSQGRVGALVNAKPADRRILLEEAAGISGLHSRRHEAELRLRAAETNLERLEDVMAALDSQLKGLKKQARQAARYRNIGDHIRKAEAVLLHLRWQSASADLAIARESLDEVAARVTEWTREAGRRTAEQAEKSTALPALRQAEAAAAAELHRLVVAREALDAEQERIRQAHQEATGRLNQIIQDMTRERGLAADAEAAAERLETERESLIKAQDEDGDRVTGAAEDVEGAEAEVDRLDGELSAVTEHILAAEARREALTRRIAEFEDRLARLRERAEALTAEREKLHEAGSHISEIQDAETAAQAAAEALERGKTAAERAEEARTLTQQREAEARTAAQLAEAKLAERRAEERALAALLATNSEGAGVPIIDDVAVTAGYEAALGAALGDDLTGSSNDDAPIRWQTLPPLQNAPPLPDGAVPLSNFVRGPAALGRRLSQIGIVADTTTGGTLWPRLAIGQRLVTAAGDLWRWDGFAVAAEAETAAVTRLTQRRRLEELRADIPSAADDAATAQAALKTAEAEAVASIVAERDARAALQQAYADLSAARDKEARLRRDDAERRSRLTALEDSSSRLASDLDETANALEEARVGAAEAEDVSEDRERQGALREALVSARARLIERRSRHDRLLRENEMRAMRIEAIEADLASWHERMANAERQIETLGAREQTTREELSRLDAAPAEIAAKRSALVDAIERAESKRKAAADDLAAAETQLADITAALRKAEAALADAREERARAEGVVSQTEQARTAIAERMAERLDCTPETALAVAELGPDDPLPDLEAVETRVERLVRERDNMGPVNLRAEQEAAELQEQIDTLVQERDDLVEAIARLRQGINELNREGRERLLVSFREVNAHFEKLFVTLFGGGRAHLELVESDDPLEAGLEIFASPPGKKLQILSLLSGGEQALTALALLFSVFLTNPAPVCILDEVDAPLDDANVDRFCALLADIAKASATRFLIVTHHRMTMARMDRLYGVTMPERGVSQLVSVDLQTAEKLRDSA